MSDWMLKMSGFHLLHEPLRHFESTQTIAKAAAGPGAMEHIKSASQLHSHVYSN